MDGVAGDGCAGIPDVVDSPTSSESAGVDTSSPTRCCPEISAARVSISEGVTAVASGPPSTGRPSTRVSTGTLGAGAGWSTVVSGRNATSGDTSPRSFVSPTRTGAGPLSTA